MYTVVGIALTRLHRQLSAIGLDPTPIFEAVELPARGRPPDFIPLHDYLMAKGLAAERLGAPDLGLRLARLSEWRSMGLMGHLIAHSPTIHQALTRRVRYGALWKQGDGLDVEVDGERVFVGYHVAQVGSKLGRRVDLDECMAVLLRTGGALAGRSIPCEEVHFAYPRPDDLEPYRAHFGDSHFVFEQASAGLVVRAEVLDWPVVGADPTLLPHLETAAAHHPKPGHDLTFSEQAEYLIGLALPALPDLDQIARSMGVSARTAARRWRMEGTSYRGLVDRVRLRFARAMLADRHISVGEIADRLGFASAASFHRAYVRWTGRTPRSD